MNNAQHGIAVAVHPLRRVAALRALQPKAYNLARGGGLTDSAVDRGSKAPLLNLGKQLHIATAEAPSQEGV